MQTPPAAKLMTMSSSQFLRLEPVPSAEVARAWRDHAAQFLEPLIQKAGTRWQLGDPIGLCSDEEGQLWLIWDCALRQACGALITQIIGNGEEKALEILALAGRGMDRWLFLAAELEAFARAHSCTLLRVYARLGLQRALKAHHWTPRQVILERLL